MTSLATTKIRWAPLTVSTASLVLGAVGLVRDSRNGLCVVALLGAAMAASVAIGALIDGERRPWPAAIALICSGPMVLLLLLTGSFRHVLEVNGMAALPLIGSAGTLCAALSILLRNRRDTIARAVARPRSSE
jgi:hypothetical protein